MTKQDEIREGIRSMLFGSFTEYDETGYEVGNQCASEILSYLHSQGVVMKVECPDCEWIQFVGEESVGMTPCYSCNSTGYVIEPFIR